MIFPQNRIILRLWCNNSTFLIWQHCQVLIIHVLHKDRKVYSKAISELLTQKQQRWTD